MSTPAAANAGGRCEDGALHARGQVAGPIATWNGGRSDGPEGAVTKLIDPAHRTEAIRFLTNADTPEDVATAVYDAAIDPAVGLADAARLSIGGLLNVLELRIQFGGFGSPQDLDYLISPASGLYDLSYYWRALGEPDPNMSCTSIPQ